MINWDDYPNFSKQEFDCTETGQNNMRPEYMAFIQQVRTIYGKPMIVNSGFRSITHSLEIVKPRVGEHTYGLAGDYKAHGADMLELAFIAYELDARRIGQYQNPKQRFIHIGLGDKFADFPAEPWTP